MIIDDLIFKNLISPPYWLKSNVQYLVLSGSHCYGIANKNSDYDIQGFVIPPKWIIFPESVGQISGFSRQIEKFNQFEQAHVEHNGDELDINIKNIVNFFRLCADCNPNVIETLFVRQDCVLHSTRIGNKVRDNRKIFLHKGIVNKIKGYAFSQLHHVRKKDTQGKRKELIEKHGYDTKAASHVVRLLSQSEQILLEGDLDLQEEGRKSHMKAIRKGEVKEKDIYDWFSSKERDLEKLLSNSKLPNYPDENAIQDLLIECLKIHYKNLDEVSQPDHHKIALDKISKIIQEINL